MNPYLYVGDDPMRSIDPSGLLFWDGANCWDSRGGKPHYPKTDCLKDNRAKPVTAQTIATNNAPQASPLPPTLACPQTVMQASSDPNFKPYHGSPGWFHCGYTGFLQKQFPPGTLQQECFYYPSGDLDQSDWCQGSPNQYDSEADWVGHTVFDQGGIISIAALKGFTESVFTIIVSPFDPAPPAW